MLPVDIIGWIGNIGFLSGAFLLARKSVLGFYGNVIGNFMWEIVGIMLNINSIWLLSLVLLGCNIYGIYQWRRT